MKTTLTRAFFVAGYLVISNCSVAEPASSELPVVATVLEKKITAADVGLQCDANHKPIIPASTPSASSPRNPLGDLCARIGREIRRDYIERNNLKATDAEIHEFQEYQDRFNAQDRMRRERTLAELDKKLKNANLSAKEKEQTEKRRATLLSLAAHDKKLDEANGQAKAADWREIAGPWIERFKFDKSIYDKYGGAVDLTKFGPEAVGAMKCLTEDYEKQGKVLIHDENLKREFWNRMNLPPKPAAKPAQIDFTPYWKKPLPKNEE